MSVGCFCGASFASVDLLYQHAYSQGHRHMCGCGSMFKDLSRLIKHQKDAPHGSSPGHTELPALKGYGTTTQATSTQSLPKCGFCPSKKAFQDEASLNQHMANKHPTCPICKQTFRGNRKAGISAKQQLFGHQKATGHCYCDEHNHAYPSTKEFTDHNRAEAHVTGFHCIECERDFGTHQGLEHHLKACQVQTKHSTVDEERAKAAFAATEEASLRCEACRKSFKDPTAFRQHKNSIKHQPISEITCFLSSKCTQKFSAPSAWLFHVESGKCKSGVTCQKLYDIVHAHDIDRHITHSHNATVMTSIKGTASFRSLNGSSMTEVEQDFDRLSVISSSLSGIVLTPDESDVSTEMGHTRDVSVTPPASDAASQSSITGGIVLTPSGSTSSSVASSAKGILLTPTVSDHPLSEWSYITTGAALTPATTSVDGSSIATLTYDTVRKVWPCNMCNRSFKTKGRLLQHCNSPTHSLKVFHCPPAATLGLAGHKPQNAFRTLSGLAQHVEGGACNGGIELLKKLIGITEKRLKIATGLDVKLLRDTS